MSKKIKCIKNKYFLISPDMLVILNVILGIVVVSIPKEVYYKYLDEADCFHLN